MPLTPYLAPVGLLIVANIFMTMAWYNHLGQKGWPLWLAIAASWGLALIEYSFAVPANRIGSTVYSVAELKTIQMVVTVTVFSGYWVFWMGEKLTLNHIAGFSLIALGAFFIFKGPLG